MQIQKLRRDFIDLVFLVDILSKLFDLLFDYIRWQTFLKQKALAHRAGQSCESDGFQSKEREVVIIDLRASVHGGKN